MKQNSGSFKRIKGMKPTFAELELIDIRRTYRALRKRYFADSNLPPTENVFILLVDNRTLNNICGDVDGCHGCYLGDGNLHTGSIVLRRTDEECTAYISLLHEMAHMSVDIKWQRSMGHGKYWKAEMKRLAALGALDNVW